MNIRFRLIPLIVLVGLAFLFMSAQPYAQSKDIRSEIAASSVLEKIKKRQTLRAGVSTFVPWVMRSKKGDLIGFEIDVAKKVAEDMGVKIEFVPTAFDGIIPALLTGKFDIIMTGIFVYPPWNLQINFSNPYNWGGMTLAANKKLTAGFDPNKDFNSSKVTITLRRGNQDGLTVIKRRFPKPRCANLTMTHRLYRTSSTAVRTPSSPRNRSRPITSSTIRRSSTSHLAKNT